LTHSNSALGSRWKSLRASMRLNSSQVWFCVSHTSVVSVPRTARAFSRAADTHETIDDGLVPSRTMKSITWRAVTAG
jgi:hypothetical protein